MSILQEIVISKEFAIDNSVTIGKIYFKDGDYVKSGQTLVELEASKAVFMVDAQVDGYIEYLCSEKEEAAVGDVIIKIHDFFKTSPKRKGTAAILDKKTTFSKGALKLIEKEKLNKDDFKELDFVGADEVRNFLDKKQNIGLKTTASYIPQADITIKKISKAKKMEISNLSDPQSLKLACPVSIFINTSGIFEFINSSKINLKNTILPIVIFEAARLLKKFPEFNAYFSEQGTVFYNDINIGVAMDLGDGLIVAKLKDAGHKSILEIDSEIIELANKYMDKKLTNEDTTGATFIITDLSSEGADFFIPLIPKEQSAILGITVTDELLNRCSLILNFDHKVTEGKKAGAFLKDLKNRLESYGKNVAELSRSLNSDIRCFKCQKNLDEAKLTQDAGLIKIVDVNGNEKFICSNCLLGW